MASKTAVFDGVAGISMRYRTSVNISDDLSLWVLPGVARRRRELS
jgi:hypothetical protein